MTEFKESTTEEIFSTSVAEKEASPEKEVSNNGDKPEETQDEDKDKSELKDKETEELKDDSEKEKSDESPPEPSVDWNSDDNPYKKYEKQYKDTRDSFTRIKQKYDKAKEEFGIEDDEKVDDETSQAELNGRIKASEMAAKQVYGEDVVKKTLYADDSPWQTLKNNPIIDFRVRSAEAPVLEAMKVVKEAEFHSKYSNDPDKIKENIRKEIEKEIRAEITKEFQEKLKQKKSLGSDLSKVKSEQITDENERFVPSSTEALFGQS